MGITNNFVAALAAICALAIAPVALGSGGVTVTTTPSHVKVGKTVEMLVKGMKADEKVKAVEVTPTGQKRTLYPRAGHAGTMIVRVKGQLKGKHVWTFTGRTSHRSGKTHYVVK
jgi:hypothetical protein